MTAPQTHKLLTWIAGITSTVTATIIISVSGAFMDMHDTLIRMERIPNTVDNHEIRLDVHDREIQTLQRQ